MLPQSVHLMSHKIDSNVYHRRHGLLLLRSAVALLMQQSFFHLASRRAFPSSLHVRTSARLAHAAAAAMTNTTIPSRDALVSQTNAFII